MKRRQFFGMVGLTGAAAAAPLAATAAAIGWKEDTKELEPDGQYATLTLSRQKKTTPPADGYYFTNYGPVVNKVELSVGKDDRLWIKVGDKWKRVAVE